MMDRSDPGFCTGLHTVEVELAEHRCETPYGERVEYVNPDTGEGVWVKYEAEPRVDKEIRLTPRQGKRRRGEPAGSSGVVLQNPHHEGKALSLLAAMCVVTLCVLVIEIGDPWLAAKVAAICLQRDGETCRFFAIRSRSRRVMAAIQACGVDGSSS
jgi:hypothetical protein